MSLRKSCKKCIQKHVQLFVSVISTSSDQKKKKKKIAVNKSNVFAAKPCYFIEEATHYHTGFKKIHQGMQNIPQIELKLKIVKGRTPSFYSVSSIVNVHI